MSKVTVLKHVPFTEQNIPVLYQLFNRTHINITNINDLILYYTPDDDMARPIKDIKSIYVLDKLVTLNNIPLLKYVIKQYPELNINGQSSTYKNRYEYRKKYN